MKLILRLLLLSLGLSLGFVGSASAQLSCTPLNKPALMALFSDNAGNSSITPANIRSLVCSLMGSGAGTTVPNWNVGDTPVYGNSGLAGDNSGPYLVDNTGSSPNVACPNILAHGGAPDGITDNSAAWTNSLSHSPVNKPCIYLPAGTYSFASQVAYNLTAIGSAVSIIGDGADTTTLTWPSGGGILINGNAGKTSFHIKGLTLLTSATNTGIALDAEWGTTNNVGGASSTIDQVHIDGAIHGTNYWATNVKLNGVSLVNVNGLDSWGLANNPASQNIGVDLTAPATNIAVGYNFVNSFFNGSSRAIRYGSYIQGVQIVNTNFVNNVIGIDVVGSVGTSDLGVLNSQLDSYTDDVRIETGAAIPNVLLSHNLFFIHAGGNGINGLGTIFGAQIQNNQFSSGDVANPTLATAIHPASFIGTSIIDSNTCINLQNCIILDAGVHETRVSNNKVSSLTTQLAVINNGIDESNVITGFINPAGFAFHYPYAIAINGAANNGSGGIRLTLAASTAGLTKGEVVSVSAPGLANQPMLYSIDIIDGSNIDLVASAFSGTYTSNGVISVVP